MGLVIRDAVEGDFEGIWLLNKNAFGYDYDVDGTRERVKFILGKVDNKIFIAELDGVVVGYAHAADYECTYSESLKNILAIAVDETQRNKGIGRALLDAVEQWAKETGSVGVRLVSGFNREKAHKFYLACGYFDRKDQKNFMKLF